VYGLAVTGASTVRALVRHGVDVIVADDTITPERLALAAELGVELIDGAGTPAVDLLDGITLLCPAPGVPETHRIIEAALAAAIEVVSELELAYRWEQQRPGGPRPMLAVTGTDGKTTTTKLTVHLLAAAGVRSIDAGNTDTPLVDTIDDPELDAFVVECSSFRLAWTPSFRADAAVWLNLQPDHLNWHRSMDGYETAKNQIFANQTANDVAIGFAPDPVVMTRLAAAPATLRSFGAAGADYHSTDTTLAGPSGDIAPLSALHRSLPHDITNALAAAALVIETGLADAPAIAAGLSTFVGPPHRLELIETGTDIAWYNDSKATTPHAAVAAIRSFERIVLIAGGADKGVDLASMAAEPSRISAVVAIGTTAASLVEVFTAAGIDPNRIINAGTLDRAVAVAAELARPGDTVLLSPGCASLDQFTNFEVRGDAFRELVMAIAAPNSPNNPNSPTSPNNPDISLHTSTHEVSA